jgi:hypothetical protein
MLEALIVSVFHTQWFGRLVCIVEPMCNFPLQVSIVVNVTRVGSMLQLKQEHEN